MNKTSLTAAGSILTVEARHSSYLRSALGQEPFPQPFDVPLDFNEVYTLAAPFIASCPKDNPKLPVKAFPSLMLATEGQVMTGSMITLMPGSDFNKSQADNVAAAFITVTGPIFVDATESDGGYKLSVPEGVNGQSYVVLTNGKKGTTDENVLAGPAIVEVNIIASP